MMNLERRKSRTIPTLLLLLPAMIFGCSSALKLNSQWRQAEISVDGERTDWEDGLTYVKEKDISLGVANDGEFLYLCLAATDPGLQRRMHGMGFTVWFDPDGGNDPKLGLRFPIGMRELALMRGEMAGSPERGERMDPEKMKSHFQEMTRYIEIIGADGGTQRRELSELQAMGIEAKTSDPADQVTYELKVPLRDSRNHPFAIGIEKTDATIGVGFETNRFEFGSMHPGMDRGRPPGGFGEPGNGTFGGRPRTGGRPQMPEQFKLWTVIQLGNDSMSIPENK